MGAKKGKFSIDGRLITANNVAKKGGSFFALLIDIKIHILLKGLKLVKDLTTSLGYL